MSVQLGWEALIRRDLEEAINQFGQGMRLNPETPESYVGMARALILMGRPNEAQPLAMQAARFAPNNAHVLLLRAEMLGEQGKRADAAQIIRQVTAREPSNGFALALLGEQRLRQGYWEDGISLFGQALNNDHDERGFAHVREVVVDMTEAVAANKIPKVEALKLVNKLDYSTPNNSTGFFAMARRALQAGKALERNASGATASPPQQRASTMSAHASQPQRSQQQTNRTSSRRAAPSSTRDNASNVRERARQRREEQRARDAHFIVDVPDISDQHELDFVKSIRRERQLNHDILEGLATLGAPGWPSDHPEPLDTLPTMANINHNSTASGVHNPSTAGIIKVDAISTFNIGVFTRNEGPAKVTHFTHLHLCSRKYPRPPEHLQVHFQCDGTQLPWKPNGTR